MKVGGPYNEGDRWRVRWTDDDGKKRTKSFKPHQKDDAIAFATELRGGPGTPVGAPGFDPSSSVAWLDLLGRLATAVTDSADQLREKVNDLTKLANAASKFVSTAEEQRRLEELERMVAEQQEIIRTRASAYQGATLPANRAGAEQGDPLH